MGDSEGVRALKQSGLNAAWFKRYEHMCAKYANKHHVEGAAKASISPLIEKNLAAKRRKRTEMLSAKLPRMNSHTIPGGPLSERDHDGRSSCPPLFPPVQKKKPPKVQVRRPPEYKQPARLRTFEARLSCRVTAAADPYSAEVRRISQNTNMSAKRIEELHGLFLDASKGRRALDLPSFRKLMVCLGQQDRSINDRMFGIYDGQRDKVGVSKMGFETFCAAVLNFKTGSRAEQANVLFKVIDVSDDRNLSKFELLKFFCSGIKNKAKKRAMSDIVNELMSLIDQDGSGEVDHDEFVEKVSEDSDVWLIFEAINPFSVMKEKLNNFNFGPVDHTINCDD